MNHHRVYQLEEIVAIFIKLKQVDDKTLLKYLELPHSYKQEK